MMIFVGCFLGLFGETEFYAYSPQLTRKPSAINRAVIVMSKPSAIFGSNIDIAPELLSSYNAVRASEKPFNAAQVVPMDMKPSENSNEVFSKVADQSLSSFFNSPEMRASPIGQTATEVEKKMKQDVSLGGSGTVEHKLSFQVQAFQGVAQMDYTGFTHACLKYQASESSVGVEIYEKVAGARDLILGHVDKPTDHLSTLSMRWNF
jgi:hypothetical protein